MDNHLQTIDQISHEISQSYLPEKEEAKAAICVFLIGCFCQHHKNVLINAKKSILSEKIFCMTMDDVSISGIDDIPHPDYSKKFKLICDKLLRSYRLPLIFMYASKPVDGCGHGANYELVTICENEEYLKLKDTFRLFKEQDAQLPHHERCIHYNIDIRGAQDFIAKVVTCALFEAERLHDILTKERGL